MEAKSSQGYTEEQAPMVGLTSEHKDEEVELETRGPAELQYNDVCGFCGAHIKYPNEKVYCDGKAMCSPCYNRIEVVDERGAEELLLKARVEIELELDDESRRRCS